jgi:transposase
MAYSKNPYLPKVRARAVKMVKTGKSIRLVSRYFGVNASTVSRWVKKGILNNLDEIPTMSSRPKKPKKISQEVINKVIELSTKFTVVEIVKKLTVEGVKISLSSIKRIIRKL